MMCAIRARLGGSALVLSVSISAPARGVTAAQGARVCDRKV